MKLNNKKLNEVVARLVFFVILFFFVAIPVFAQDFVGPKQQDYLVVCGVGLGDLCTICDIWALADKVINFLLFTLATPILIIVLIVGGFIYLTSGGNPKKTETAKGLITSAIFGIIIAFAAWLIVDTILKTLVKGNLTIAWQEIEECPDPIEPEVPDLSKLPKLPPIITTPGTYTDEEARQQIELAGILIHSSGNCSDQQNPQCTSFEGIPKSAVGYILELDRMCNSQSTTCGRFVITAGTEIGHATHGTNKSVIDIAPLNPPTETAQNAQRYRTLRDLAKSARALPTKTFCEKFDGTISLDCVSADHIHVEFPR